MPRLRAPTPRRARAACLAALDTCPHGCSFVDDYYTGKGGSATVAAVVDLWHMATAAAATPSSGTRDARTPSPCSSSLSSLSSSSSRAIPARHCECCDAAAMTTAQRCRPPPSPTGTRHATASTAVAADVYDRAREVARQEQFVRESSCLGGPFIPACASGALRTPTRLLLGDCVRALYRVLARDWPDAAPRLVTTAEDLLVVSFATHGVASRRVRALHLYMTSAPHCTAVLRRFALQRVQECWHVLTHDGHVLYALRPPWVRKHRFVYTPALLSS